MPDLDIQPDYRQQTISGSQWTRCLHIEANNPYGGQPSIRFDEEVRVVTTAGKKAQLRFMIFVVPVK